MRKKTYRKYARAKYIVTHKVDVALVVPGGDNLMPLNGGWARHSMLSYFIIRATIMSFDCKYDRLMVTRIFMGGEGMI